MSEKFQSGFVSIIGRPNVGKSTLLNHFAGEKVAIISNKPQTTRNQIKTVVTGENHQIVFIDTPGLHAPKSKLGDYMVKSAKTTFSEVDVVLFLIDATRQKKDEDILEMLKSVKTPVLLIINKVDAIDKQEILKLIDSYRDVYSFKEIVPISALTGENTEELSKLIVKHLPEGPKYFPDDTLTDQPERQIVSEIIREKLLLCMDEEIPHGTAVEVVSMKERAGKDIVDVEAMIYCEKESHKGMIIGKGGQMLKNIGTKARRDIERLLGSPVNLQIWVKPKKDWRNNDFYLRNFGYK